MTREYDFTAMNDRLEEEVVPWKSSSVLLTYLKISRQLNSFQSSDLA